MVSSRDDSQDGGDGDNVDDGPWLWLIQLRRSADASSPSVCISYIFFSRFVTFFSIFYVRSLEYFYVFSDPNIHFWTEVRSYPKNVPTSFLKIGASEA